LRLEQHALLLGRPVAAPDARVQMVEPPVMSGEDFKGRREKVRRAGGRRNL